MESATNKAPVSSLCNGIPLKRARTDEDDKKLMSEDEFYFKSYESMDSHYTMLTDRVRTLAYKRAIEAMRARLQGATVIDVGSGTGILSMFCARAGASKVYGIEANAVSELSRQVIDENGLSDAIEIVNCVAEEAELPVASVDAIVSEWMGYCLLCENMLASVLVVRDKFLARDGLMFPCHARLLVAGAEGEQDADAKEQALWSSLSRDYGLDMGGSLYTSMQQSLIDNAVVTEMPPQFLVTSSGSALDIDLYTVQAEAVRHLSGAFELAGHGTATMSHLVFWFATQFPDGSVLSTGPRDKPTHWMQTVVKMPKPFPISQQSRISGKLKFQPAGHEKRSIKISVELEHFERGNRMAQTHFDSFL